MANKADIQREVDLNFDAFQQELPKLGLHAGKYALMKSGKIINYYDTLGDALSSGRVMYDDGLFSIQQVQVEPVNLGFLSYAVHSS